MVATTMEKRQDGVEASPLEAAMVQGSSLLETDKCGGPDTISSKSSSIHRQSSHAFKKTTKSSGNLIFFPVYRTVTRKDIQEVF
jgi:hypothetical protein